MAINTGIICESSFLTPDCHGTMVYSDPPDGGDHDDYGVKDSFCNSCGSEKNMKHLLWNEEF